MKVKQFIKELQKLNPDAEIVLSCDAEGNSYRLFAAFGECVQSADGEIYDLDWSADDCCLEEKEWEALKKSKKSHCGVLWPSD